MDAFIARWHSDEGVRTVLVKRGRTKLHLLVQDHPMRVAHVDAKEERHVRPIDYPLNKAVRKMREFAKHGNATAGAMAMLKECQA